MEERKISAKRREQFDKQIGRVIAVANKMAQELIVGGELVSVVLGEEEGEASWLSVIVPGDRYPYYIQPEYPMQDELEDGPNIPFYIEREPLEVPDWEPIPVAVYLESDADIEDGLTEVFDHILTAGERQPHAPAGVPAARN